MSAANDFFSRLDTNGDGVISREEFYIGSLPQQGPANPFRSTAVAGSSSFQASQSYSSGQQEYARGFYSTSMAPPPPSGGPPVPTMPVEPSRSVAVSGAFYGSAGAIGGSPTPPMPPSMVAQSAPVVGSMPPVVTATAVAPPVFVGTKRYEEETRVVQGAEEYRREVVTMPPQGPPPPEVITMEPQMPPRPGEYQGVQIIDDPMIHSDIEPEFYERIIEVPKVQIEHREKIIEVPEPQIVDRIVEVPQVQEVIHELPGPVDVQIVTRAVPKIEIRQTERIVEVPQIEYQDRYVEVPQIVEVVRRVPRIEVHEIPIERIIQEPKKKIEYIEQKTYCPVPRLVQQTVEREIPVPVPQVETVEVVKQIPIIENYFGPGQHGMLPSPDMQGMFPGPAPQIQPPPPPTAGGFAQEAAEAPLPPSMAPPLQGSPTPPTAPPVAAAAESTRAVEVTASYAAAGTQAAASYAAAPPATQTVTTSQQMATTSQQIGTSVYLPPQQPLEGRIVDSYPVGPPRVVGYGPPGETITGSYQVAQSSVRMGNVTPPTPPVGGGSAASLQGVQMSTTFGGGTMVGATAAELAQMQSVPTSMQSVQMMVPAQTQSAQMQSAQMQSAQMQSAQMQSMRSVAMQQSAGGQGVVTTTAGAFSNPFGSQMSLPPASFQSPRTEAPAAAMPPPSASYGTSYRSVAVPQSSVIMSSQGGMSAQGGSAYQSMGAYQAQSMSAYQSQSAMYQSGAYQSATTATYQPQQYVSIQSGPFAGAGSVAGSVQMMSSRSAMAGASQPPADLFDALDTNHDGVLTREELEQAMISPAVRVP